MASGLIGAREQCPRPARPFRRRALIADPRSREGATQSAPPTVNDDRMASIAFAPIPSVPGFSAYIDAAPSGGPPSVWTANRNSAING
jgi:hypothetical protein